MPFRRHPFRGSGPSRQFDVVLRASRQERPTLPELRKEETAPNEIHVLPDLPNLVAPPAQFAPMCGDIPKNEAIFQWIRNLKFDVLNSPKLMAEIMWIFFYSQDEDS